MDSNTSSFNGVWSGSPIELGEKSPIPSFLESVPTMKESATFRQSRGGEQTHMSFFEMSENHRIDQLKKSLDGHQDLGSSYLNFRMRDGEKRKYSILMCTDFTVPKFGGVETHGF